MHKVHSTCKKLSLLAAPLFNSSQLLVQERTRIAATGVADLQFVWLRMSALWMRNTSRGLSFASVYSAVHCVCERWHTSGADSEQRLRSHPAPQYHVLSGCLAGAATASALLQPFRGLAVGGAIGVVTLPLYYYLYIKLQYNTPNAMVANWLSATSAASAATASVLAPPAGDSTAQEANCSTIVKSHADGSPTPPSSEVAPVEQLTALR